MSELTSKELEQVSGGVVFIPLIGIAAKGFAGGLTTGLAVYAFMMR